MSYLPTTVSARPHRKGRRRLTQDYTSAHSTRSLKNVDRPYDVDFNVVTRIGNRFPYIYVRGEMADQIGFDLRD